MIGGHILEAMVWATCTPEPPAETLGMTLLKGGRPAHARGLSGPLFSKGDAGYD